MLENVLLTIICYCAIIILILFIGMLIYKGNNIRNLFSNCSKYKSDSIYFKIKTLERRINNIDITNIRIHELDEIYTKIMDLLKIRFMSFKNRKKLLELMYKLEGIIIVFSNYKMLERSKINKTL